MAQTNVLRVEIGSSRSANPMNLADAAVRRFATNVAQLTSASRTFEAKHGRWASWIPMTLPVRVQLTSGGAVLKTVRTQTRSNGDLTLRFDSSGANAFTTDQQTFFQNVFNSVVSTLDSIYGMPAQGGDVWVRNYDATIDDRDASAGGYYVPNNGSGQREIRLPVYQSQEVTAVNFIHTLLLAYQGDTPYAYDAFQEGLARAATIIVCRQPSLLAGLDSSQIENVLESTYDVGGLYDWYNGQRALGGSKFIAPNLLGTALPAGGDTGGIYLSRYKMAGTAWEKVLIEYPTFIARLNAAVAANPSLASDVPGLVAQGQTILNALRPSDPTIEGLSFADWFSRQSILETHDTNGLKLFVQPFPVTGGLSGTDFSVFGVEAQFFQRTSDGNETLLSGTGYPVFWDPLYAFTFTPTGADKFTFSGAYGSVEPNFEDDYGGQAYRVAVDVAVQDQNVRVNLPAGAIATPANEATPNDFYGTIEGLNIASTQSVHVKLLFNSTTLADVPVTNYAFGTLINTDLYLQPHPLTVQIVDETAGANNVLYTRRVNKPYGPLALDLHVGGDGTYTFPNGLPKGISAVGFPIDPYSSYAPDILGVTPSQLLAARYDQSKAKYQLYPDVEPFKIGLGYFLEMPAATPLTIAGRVTTESTSVALRPGWNLVTTPLNMTVPTSQIRVVHATDFPANYADAVGAILGADFFSFLPGQNDPSTGAPETGAFTAATSFQPGQAYFVRCLAAEGAVLVFDPVSRARSFHSDMLKGLPTATATTTTTPPLTWQLQINASGNGAKSDCYVQMSRTATTGFDPKEDSTLPPSVSGGFQASLVGASPLYRDTRPTSASQSYGLRLDGLVKGQTYTIVMTQTLGLQPRATLVDSVNHVKLPLKNSTRYSFRATATSQTFTISVGGA